MGLLAPDAQASDAELANLIFTPGFSTAEACPNWPAAASAWTWCAPRSTRMGGRIETATAAGQGTSFRLVLPLTTAVTQVVMLRCGELSIGVPSTLVEMVRRIPGDEIEQAYASGAFTLGDKVCPSSGWAPCCRPAGAAARPAARSRW